MRRRIRVLGGGVVLGVLVPVVQRWLPSAIVVIGIDIENPVPHVMRRGRGEPQLVLDLAAISSAPPKAEASGENELVRCLRRLMIVTHMGQDTADQAVLPRTAPPGRPKCSGRLRLFGARAPRTGTVDGA